VITPYNAQVSLLRDALLEKWKGIEISTADGFQGREKEAIVISMVRSNSKREVGFLSEARRMNVAITRAKRHVCVVCDSTTVSSDPFLSRLVAYAQNNCDYRSAAEYLDSAWTPAQAASANSSAAAAAAAPSTSATPASATASSSSTAAASASTSSSPAATTAASSVKAEQKAAAIAAAAEAQLKREAAAPKPKPKRTDASIARDAKDTLLPGVSKATHNQRCLSCLPVCLTHSPPVCCRHVGC
jgi:ATP-dependent exoDNAse (exonuclease V) beta subunit